MPIAFRSSGEDSRVSAKRLSAPVTHQRLVLNKAGFWPAQAPSRTALLAAALLGMAGIGAGCSSDSPVSGLVKDDDSSDSHSDARELPQGVIAPYQPVQPGDARLGADGHYDYTAEDFVLRHPCDDQELMAKLKEKGWSEWEGAFSNTDEPNLKGCVINSSNFEYAPILLGSLNPDFTAQENGAYLQRLDDQSNLTGYFGELTNQMASMCFYGFDTSHGVTGIFVTYGEYSEFQTQSEACRYLDTVHSTLIGGLE